MTPTVFELSLSLLTFLQFVFVFCFVLFKFRQVKVVRTKIGPYYFGTRGVSQCFWFCVVHFNFHYFMSRFYVLKSSFDLGSCADTLNERMKLFVSAPHFKNFFFCLFGGVGGCADEGQ